MNTSIVRPSVQQSVGPRHQPRPSREAGQLVALGRAHYWPFQVLGQAPMIAQPVRLGDWLMIPAQQDSTAIPARAISRIQAIFAAGIRPEGFVLVHEAPKLLKAPPAAPAEPRPMSGATYSPEGTSDFATSLANGLAALASTILPMLFFVVAAAMADPILVAVMNDDLGTEDPVWVEIDRWDTE